VFAQAGHRAIAFDLPGFGASPLPVEPITMAGYGRIVDELLGHLDVSAAGVATRYIGLPVRLMDRYSELVLGRAGRWLTPVPARTATIARRRRLRHAAFALLSPHPERLDPRLFYENTVASGAKPGGPRAAAEIARYDFRDRLDDIACPTLVVWGDRDHVVPPTSAEEFERLIPDSRLVIFEDCGHVPMLEQPDRFNRLVLDFLAEQPGEEVDETSQAA
jgi:pimeloyl-ACP methyl ester carboxylesterase